LKHAKPGRTLTNIMHELSIAMSIIELAQEESHRHGDVQVSAVHLKLGALSGVVKEALLGSFEMACEDTPLKGARLVVEEVPVLIFCRSCQTQRPVSSMQLFCCAECGAPSSEVVQGKEIEMVALEIEEWDRSPV
jgi:hydrogenase nickel incorporation protein HypA/HybF